MLGAEPAIVVGHLVERALARVRVDAVIGEGATVLRALTGRAALEDTFSVV